MDLPKDLPKYAKMAGALTRLALNKNFCQEKPPLLNGPIPESLTMITMNWKLQEPITPASGMHKVRKADCSENPFSRLKATDSQYPAKTAPNACQDPAAKTAPRAFAQKKAAIGMQTTRAVCSKWFRATATTS